MYGGTWWYVSYSNGTKPKQIGKYLEFPQHPPSYLHLTQLQSKEWQVIDIELRNFLRRSIRQICDWMRFKNAVSMRISWAGLKGRPKKIESRLIVITMKRMA